MGSSLDPTFCTNLNCQSSTVKVVETRTMPDGTRMRRRRCRQCGHKWYTVQPPEQEIEGWRLIWSKRGVVGLRPLPESPENRKV